MGRDRALCVRLRPSDAPLRPMEAVAQTPGELTRSVLRVGSETLRVVRRGSSAGHDVAPLLRSGTRFSERAAPSPRALYATASRGWSTGRSPQWDTGGRSVDAGGSKSEWAVHSQQQAYRDQRGSGPPRAALPDDRVASGAACRQHSHLGAPPVRPIDVIAAAIGDSGVWGTSRLRGRSRCTAGAIEPAAAVAEAGSAGRPSVPREEG